MRDIEQIIERIKAAHPSVSVEQLAVSHPGADDDGIWFFVQPQSAFEVQAESSTGMCPFVIETDESDARFTAESVEKAVAEVTRLLRLE
ncbi:MAG TPA: hypothetical protein VGF20_07120 [Candidatus Acidoferrum sp.]|jgi:hypothetical protein